MGQRANMLGFVAIWSFLQLLNSAIVVQRWPWIMHKQIGMTAFFRFVKTGSVLDLVCRL